ncbi:MAG: GntR family transcriptional regulator [Deinococcus sp.]|nr:GntR family transcriptional regulator [Deinococcus sp.]
MAKSSSETGIVNLGTLARAGSHRSQTTPDTISGVLREAISKGLLKAGEPLKGDDLARQLGVSRIPVREALRQLASEGLVTYYPNRGAVVAALTPEEIREIYQIRKALEAHALQESIRQLSPTILKKAKEALEASRRANDEAEWGQLDIQFHEALYSLENRPRLAKMIDNLLNTVDRYWHIYGLNHKQRRVFDREHKQILEACLQKNSKQAVALLQAHLDHAAAMLIRTIAGGAKTDQPTKAAVSPKRLGPRKPTASSPGR